MNWLTAHGFELPVRSSCICCPFHSDQTWRDLTDKEFAIISDWDEKVRDEGLRRSNVKWKDPRVWLHRSQKPIKDRPFDDSDESDLEREECLGGCFL